MKKLFLLLLVLAVPMVAQVSKPPVFPGCSADVALAEDCFTQKVHEFVQARFMTPADLPDDHREVMMVLFEVNPTGNFNILYQATGNTLLADEVRRVFGELPTVVPASYNGEPTYAKFTLRLEFPLNADAFAAQQAPQTTAPVVKTAQKPKPQKQPLEPLDEFETLPSLAFNHPQFNSRLNIPFSHSHYAKFDAAMNRVGANNHTGSKPFHYADVNRYYDLAAAEASIRKNKTSLLGRKLWNENMVRVQGEDYWFTLDPIFDLQMGKSSDKRVDYTYINTRGLRFEGGLGENLNFTTTVYETQARFDGYVNAYAESIAPSGGNPAVIPGMGIAKAFKQDAYDIPLAEANLSYTPSKFLNLNLGYGRNFIGDGYRSMLLGDGVSPHPYVKINTTFWKIRYTNIYTWLKDVRPDVTVDGTYATKYAAAHYLSLNLTKRWNIGLFESVVWAKKDNRGFDMSFVNPIIFYRSVEFASSSRSGNALLALTTKYKFSDQWNFYAQYLLDEFSLADMRSGDQSWKNKFGYQLGLKYFDAFGLENLVLQAEYNHARPYLYSHSDPVTNYGHVNQSLAHPWGGNFREFAAIGRYHHGRYFADAKVTIGQRGFDFNSAEDTFNYGSNIYRDYNTQRPYETGVTVGQGNKTNIFIADVQAGYLVNPATNLKLFASVIYRNFDPTAQTPAHFSQQTTWFSVGLRSDVFNWYFDF